MSDIGLENLVNVLHHFAFGDTKSSGYNFKLNSITADMPVASTSTITPNHTLKKFKNLDDTATSMARSTVDQQPSLDFKQFIPKLIGSDTFREDNQAQQSVAHLSTSGFSTRVSLRFLSARKPEQPLSSMHRTPTGAP